MNRRSLRNLAPLALLCVAPWSLCAQEIPDAAPVRALAGRLSGEGLSETDIQSVLKPVREAVSAGLPVGLVTEKVEEGLAKAVPAADIAAAAERRVQCASRALAMIEAGTSLPSAAAWEDLVAAATLALETGVPPEVLERVLAHGVAQHRLGRLAHALRAGETLHLSGFSGEETESLMMDFLDRDLRRSEMIRATRYATQQRRQGRPQEGIRQGLWGRGTAQSPGSVPGSPPEQTRTREEFRGGGEPTLSRQAQAAEGPRPADTGAEGTRGSAPPLRGSGPAVTGPQGAAEGAATSGPGATSPGSGGPASAPATDPGASREPARSGNPQTERSADSQNRGNR